MNDTTKKLFSFIEQSPTAFHAVANGERALEHAGFQRLREGAPWKLEANKGYYVTRNQSSLIAFRVPERITGFMVGSAHTDSPCLKLKENMELHPEGYTKLDVEKYGGLLFSPWLDRPLSVAGRLMVKTDGRRGPGAGEHRPGPAGDPQPGHPHGPDPQRGEEMGRPGGSYAALGKGERQLKPYWRRRRASGRRHPLL